MLAAAAVVAAAEVVVHELAAAVRRWLVPRPQLDAPLR